MTILALYLALSAFALLSSYRDEAVLILFLIIVGGVCAVTWPFAWVGRELKGSAT